MVPAGAASFATKKFVKKQVNKVAKRVTSLKGTVADLNRLIYVQGAVVSIATADTFGQAEAVCPAGSRVTGGGGFSELGFGFQIDSYPSHGVGFDPTSFVAPAGHTAWVFEYRTGSSAEDIRAYAVCAKVDTSSGYTPGSLPRIVAERPAA
jgi:hypothetical protein